MNVDGYKKRTINEVTSSCDFTPPRIESSTLPGPLTKRHRKLAHIRSIHFADDSCSTDFPFKKPLHTTYLVENWMNIVEKEDLWMHPQEILLNVVSLRSDGTLYQQQLLGDTSHRAYSEALQSSFIQCCCCDSPEIQGQLDSCDCNEMEKCLATVNYQLIGLNRGIEAYCVPNLAMTRSSVRKNLIQTIVLIDQVLRCHPHRDMLLGNISRPLTIPSQRFARMMGIVDERNASAVAYPIPIAATSNPMCSAKAVAA